MAYVYTLDPTVPNTASGLVKDGAQVIREFKSAVIERLETIFTDIDVDPLTILATRSLAFTSLTLTGTGIFADALGWKATTADAGMYIATSQLALGTYTGSAAEIKINLSTHVVAFSGAVTFVGSTTAARTIASTDITNAVAKAVIGDGTGFGSNDVGIANVPGFVASVASTVTSGTVAGSTFAFKQTAATSGAAETLRAYSWMANTSGTSVLGVAFHASGQADGNGGTTTAWDLIRAGNFVVGTGHTVTTLRQLHVTSGAKTGTITTLVGLEIDDVTLGTTNYAIRTGLGSVLFGGAAFQVNGVATFVDNVNMASGLTTINGATGNTVINATLQVTGQVTLGLGGGTGIVSVGAVDSGAAGFRLLRVPN